MPRDDDLHVEWPEPTGPGMPARTIVPLDPLFNIDDEFLSETEASPPQQTAVPIDANIETRIARPEQDSAPASGVGVESTPAAANFEIKRSFDDAEEAVLSVSELLENDVVVDWPEAVAITRRICEAIGQHPSAGTHEYLLDTRHIEITADGDVRVLPGEPGGDPFVKQVGRILRALLEAGNAPVSLRLLASQAAFELPGFATVTELSEALRTFEARSEPDAIRNAFRRGQEARGSRPLDHGRLPSHNELVALPAPSTIPVAQRFSKPVLPARRHVDALVAAAVVIMLIGGVAVKLARQSSDRGVSSDATAAQVSTRAQSVEPARSDVGGVPENAMPQPVPSRDRGTAQVAPLESRPDRPAKPVPARPFLRVTPMTAPPRPLLPVPTAESVAGIANTPRTEPVLDDIESARMTFDLRVLADPLYQLDSIHATPQAVAALSESKRLLLPGIAKREYLRGQTEFQAGEYTAAIRTLERALRLMGDSDFGPVPLELRERVQQLLTEVRAARTLEDNRVYTMADLSVIPPIEQGRQLPEATPAGIPAAKIGQLEMVIGRNGLVEIVKLHTPLNRYHERMIVSAAKAWRYLPATKNGEPVRFRMFLAVNLPEN